MNSKTVNRLNIRQAKNVTLKAVGFAALLAVILGCDTGNFPAPVALETVSQISRRPSAIEDEAYTKCMDDAESAFIGSSDANLRWYMRHGKKAPNYNSRPRMIRGTNGKVVVLVHGFLSSPASMKDLSEVLAAKGYTVILPLMLGFGADKEAVAASNPNMWQASIQSAIESAKKCHKSVAVVAHSLGAGLATDLIANKGTRGVRSLVLLAPYFQIGNENAGDALEALEGITDVVTMREMSRIFDIDLYKLLKMDRPGKDDVDPFLPVKATQQLIALHDRFKRTQYDDPLVSPKVLLVVSENDEMIDHHWADYYPSVRFQNLTKIVYREQDQISHSLQTKKSNSKFDEMATAIVKHLN